MLVKVCRFVSVLWLFSGWGLGTKEGGVKLVLHPLYDDGGV